MKRLGLTVIFLVLAACGSVPLTTKQDAQGTTGGHAILDQQRSMLPDRFQAVGSIVFEFAFGSVSGIGYVDIDAQAGSYKVACMNQLGVKIFQFQGDRSGPAGQFVIEPLAKRGNVAAAVGEDITRVYLDLVPDTTARMTRKGNSIVFRQRSGEGTLEYEFSGNGAQLIKKTYREDHRAVWRVSYGEYELKNGKLYPMLIHFANYRHGYRLIVRQKEIRG